MKIRRMVSTCSSHSTARRLDGLVALADAEAILLDEREAPAREMARQQKRTNEDRVREETVRRVNKAAFRP
jgi:hypothetical protein